MSSFRLLGAPLDLGGAAVGVDQAPQAFRGRDIIGKLNSAGLDITDGGDIDFTRREQLEPGNPKLRYLDEIVRFNERLAARTEQAVRAGDRCVVLGGDHAICLGSVAGASVALDGNIGLIYLDAHGDMNTHETTPTGNIHGMDLSALMGFGAPELTGLHGGFTKLSPHNLVHIGGSDFDDSERQLMQRENIPSFGLHDLLTGSLAPALDLISSLAARVDHVWISLDLDCIDEMYAPAAGMPNKKGLTYREIATIAEHIGATCHVAGVEVVEYVPSQDVNHKTAELAIELIATFFGKTYNWYTAYLEHNKS